jgi:Asp-tRNA(Asn)/Glu-tRNA(Gln) amidotransferase A subunit family amidase
MPSITLPAGKAKNGLPLGVQLVARFGADEMLVSFCREIEGGR